MKLLSTGLVLGLVLGLADTVVAGAAASDSRSAGSDWWAGYDPTDIAPVGCAKPTAFFNCYKVVSKYAYCDPADDACSCSSVLIDQHCFNDNCGTSISFNSHDSSMYCTGTATVGMSALAQITASPGKPANTEATPTPTAASNGGATPTGTPSGSAAAKPNAGERSMRVSGGGLIAVAAAAMGSLFYRF